MEYFENIDYLGSIHSKDCTLTSDVVEKVNHAKKISRALEVITRNRNVITEVKDTLGDSVLLPAALYGGETWTLLGGCKSRLRAVVMGVPEECMSSRLEG